MKVWLKVEFVYDEMLHFIDIRFYNLGFPH